MKPKPKPASKPDPAARAIQMQRAADTARWMDTAMRPDLHAAPVQRSAAGEAKGQALPAAGGGQAMPEGVRAKMEGSLGADFSAVRVHEGPRAEALGARAYTQGADIHFAPGEYQPHSPAGQALLGHELTHVVQQSQGRVQATTQAKGVGVNDDSALEREADELGARAARGEPAAGAVGRAAAPVQASRGPIQRAPVGTRNGEDGDRDDIEVANLVGNETVNLKGDGYGRAQIMSDFIVNGTNFTGKKLKHYMVVKSGTCYQFPIKHVYQPRRDNLGGGGYLPNRRVAWGDHNATGVRGGQPEGFGGNDDLAQHATVNNVPLANRRNATLDHEYEEENHDHNNATLTVRSSKKFGYDYGAGTLSLAETDQDLGEGYNAHSLDPVAERGEAEMAGTIVIDCDDLIDGVLVGDDLEEAIEDKLIDQRDALYQNTAGRDPRNERSTDSPFCREGGILAHLVVMVRDDIIAQRQVRQEARAQQLLRQAQVEAQNRQEAQNRRAAQQKFIALCLLFGLPLLAAFAYRLFL